MILGIKVDCDTYQGIKEGVPKLLEIFHMMEIKASFFITMGPDNSGHVIKRIFKKGFLKRMVRIGAHRVYPIKTLLYGTLLPPPLIGKSCRDLIIKIKDSGHEVGIHGYDHVKWQDQLDCMSYNEIKDEFQRAVDEYFSIFKTLPKSSAAPAWKCNEASFSVEDENGLLYHSDTKGYYPYFVKIGNTTFKTLEIPATLPMIDEVAGSKTFSENEMIQFYVSSLKKGKLNILTIHPEFEGNCKSNFLEEFLKKAFELSFTFASLEDIANDLLKSKENIPVCESTQVAMDGRTNKVCYQKA